MIDLLLYITLGLFTLVVVGIAILLLVDMATNPYMGKRWEAKQKKMDAYWDSLK